MKTKLVRHEIDMCSGPILPGILKFALPLLLTNVLQLAFNAADTIVIGQFGSGTAMAAVGSTGSLIGLIVNLFGGLSIGVNVLIANYKGAGREKDAQDTVHTAILTSFIGGVVLMFVGLLLARPLLQLMGTPDNVIDQAVLYMQIYFCGLPFAMPLNFGSAALRAVGDTRRPMVYLTIAGVVNVVLNLIFVLVFHMDVAGVALATIVSQAVSAVLILRCMMRTEGICHLNLKKLKIHGRKLLKMVQIGLPAGIQSSLFGISNVLIQSSVNSFGHVVMNGNTAAANIENFVYFAMNAISQAALSFTSQNYGAGNYRRIHKVRTQCILTVVFGGAIFGNLVYLLGPYLLQLYNTDPAVIQYGLNRMVVIATTYFLCGLMEVESGVMRGLGYSLLPTVISLLGSCAFRVLWIFTVFAQYHTQFVLYLSYPISWLLTCAAYFVCYQFIRKKKFPQE